MPLALIALTGPRAWTDTQLLEDTMLSTWHDALAIGYTGIEVMQGCAEGFDTLGGQWAVRNGLPVRERPADWEGPCGPTCQPGHRRRKRNGRDYCPQAGHRRNQTMVDEKAALFIAGIMPCTAANCARKAPHNSHGATDCIRRAEAAGIPVHRIKA